MSTPAMLRLFIASASDCDELREAALRAIASVNHHYKQDEIIINSYLWEKDKIPGYITNPNDYQNQVFEEAKLADHCDIFTILFWTKLGEGTKKEYEFFEKVCLNQSIKPFFICCHYGKDIPHDVLATHRTYYDLMDYIRIKEPHWAPLGNIRRDIDEKDKFETFYRDELSKYIRKKFFNRKPV